ncbi:ABC transporter ATP-binding protein [bacterium]|nr:ABC transporter ATP-binding protein [bacterium]
MSSEPIPADVALDVCNVSKRYEIYSKPTYRLKQILWGGRRNYHTEFWALNDINFRVERGEALGIIGRNGAGKSTLLQVIAGTLKPTTGEVNVRGRVTALLELGSGFNLEFTGWENVRLNGAILGLSQAEIENRLDAIAAFADIGDFINQPVKTYSTGMLVRLAFAVQVQVDPDILIIDEALAVGDVAFQSKCMSRMKKLIDRGVVIILVTHDVGAVRTLCNRAIWLDKGRMREVGAPLQVTSQYVQHLFTEETGQQQPEEPVHGVQPVTIAPAAEDPNARKLTDFSTRSDLVRWGSGEIRVEGVSIDNGTPAAEPLFEYGDTLHIEAKFRAVKDVDSHDIGFGFAFRNMNGLDIITYTTHDAGLRIPPLKAGQAVRFAFELKNILFATAYALVVNVEEVRGPLDRHYYDFVENAIMFKVVSEFQIFSAVLPPVRQLAYEVEPLPSEGSHVASR